jgi:hypothetical protein
MSLWYCSVGSQVESSLLPRCSVTKAVGFVSRAKDWRDSSNDFESWYFSSESVVSEE